MSARWLFVFVVLAAGCHLGAETAPVSFVVAPNQITTQYHPDALWPRPGQLSATLTNTSTREVRVVAQGDGPFNVESIRCSGKMTPRVLDQSYVTHPIAGYA